MEVIMRRKYDIRNKKSFVIILLVVIIVIAIFSLFIYEYKQADKIEYKIDNDSVIQDTNGNYLEINEDAILKKRWNDNYYLVYQDKKINFGKKLVIYNTITGKMKLYGTFYEIKEDGKIVDNKNETVLDNVTDTKFYKAADREYLLVDRIIISDDRKIETANYLLVELDKLGNAKLSNNKINLKTITETKLVTTKYTFDINNEILNYGKYDIDLKKIIGSSNQYLPSSSGSGSGSGTGGGSGSGSGSGNGTGTGGNGSGSGSGSGNGTGGGTGNGVINTGENGKPTSPDEIKDKIKMTSIVRVTEGLNQIDFDYVIYDPYNEYKDVYAEIKKTSEIEIVHLSKTDTHLVINNLNPNTEYKIDFIYTSLNENGEVVPTTFETMSLKTKMPKYSIAVYKLNNVTNVLSYKVYLQEGYKINKVDVNLSFKYHVVDLDSGSTTVKDGSIDSSLVVDTDLNYVVGSFDISGYDIVKGSLVKLKINGVNGSFGYLPVVSTSSFKYGG